MGVAGGEAERPTARQYNLMRLRALLSILYRSPQTTYHPLHFGALANRTRRGS
jgi:hypothetical protein